jgi:hypothetical protein
VDVVTVVVGLLAVVDVTDPEVVVGAGSVVVVGLVVVELVEGVTGTVFAVVVTELCGARDDVVVRAEELEHPLAAPPRAPNTPTIMKMGRSRFVIEARTFCSPAVDTIVSLLERYRQSREQDLITAPCPSYK